MLLRKTGRFWKNGLNSRKIGRVVCFLLILFGIKGCGNAFQPEVQTIKEGKEVSVLEESYSEEADQMDKGYDLPVNEQERKEAEGDCERVMNLIFDIYEHADKGGASNVALSDKTVLEMQQRVKETGYPVTTTMIYSVMENYDVMDDFLRESEKGESGSVVIYEIHFDGGIGRRKYIFDDNNMYLLYTKGVWDKLNQPKISYVSYTRIKEWKYTDKGWFGYELCVPEPPEVSEIVDGSSFIRVKPISDEYRDIAERCVLGLGYLGNNLLCSNWDVEHLEDLDYNGLYEYLYKIKYQKEFDFQNYLEGIPKEEFENLIKEYLPVTVEQIQEYAVFDEENQTYTWVMLGCGNYSPTYFGTSVPEVTDIKENGDGTVTLTVDAVCDMILCNDAVITHELTLQFSEDGTFRYLSNKILNNGIRNIPRYQYRLGNH